MLINIYRLKNKQNTTVKLRNQYVKFCTKKMHLRWYTKGQYGADVCGPG
jgi:hypothetical protein